MEKLKQNHWEVQKPWKQYNGEAGSMVGRICGKGDANATYNCNIKVCYLHHLISLCKHQCYFSSAIHFYSSFYSVLE